MLAHSVDAPSIGNTCFLNSLLQYLFAIKELRDIIAEHSQFAEDDPVEGVLSTKRVGSRVVENWEILRAKRCAWRDDPQV